jgi:transposase InsO family protein
MASISQEMKYRESLMKYVEKNGVKRAARKYNRGKSYIYFWKNRYDGTINSLWEHSKRPHTQPHQHTAEELTLIKNVTRRNPTLGLMDLWYKLRAKGYNRGVTGLYKALKRLKISLTPPLPKYVPKPYEQMTFPGQRVQIDVKWVPRECLVDAPKELKLYQYTAIDEYSRLRYLLGFSECNTYTSKLFLEQTIKFFKYHQVNIKCVRTDNGVEFTKKLLARDDLNLSLFELTALQHNIQYHHIKPHTPRHNGKVERSHREDQKLFYNHNNFFNLTDFKTQLKRHQTRTNNRPMRPLNFLSPREFLARYQKT